MPHVLEQKIGAVRRRARGLVLLYALSWLVGAGLAAVVLLGLVDYLVHLEDHGVRLIASLAVLAAVGWVAYQFLLPGVRSRLRDVDIALRIERRFPGLNDRLSSAVQFLRESEDAPEAGSAALRRAVVIQTTAEVERLDLGQVIKTGAVVWAAVVAIGISLVAAGVAALDPASAGIAVTRLANPWGGPAWPQRTHLIVRGNPPQRLALGEEFQLAVIDQRGARLPDQVRLHLRYLGDDAAADEEVVPMQFNNGAMLYSKAEVRRPFEYRAEGGDDNSMPWRALEVVEPPALVDLDVKLHYPAYTGWPVEAGEMDLRALKGTRVEMTATCTKPLRSARLELAGGVTVPAQILADGYGFRFPVTGTDHDFVVRESGTYRILLEDAEGVTGGRDAEHSIRVLADLPPSVSIEQPEGNIYVTADAVVPLAVSAKDDLALARMDLVFIRTDQSDQGLTSVPLWAGPEQAPTRGGGPATADAGDSRRVEYRWELASLGLKPGVQVTFHAAAADYLPQTGESQPRRLTVITRDDLEAHVAERQNFILGELARVLKMQQDARTQVSGLEIQLGQMGHLTKPDLDHLQAAELAQRQVDRGLTSTDEGIPAQVNSLLADLENNHVDSPDIQRRMESLLTEIGRLEREHLPPIGQALTSAIKGAESRLPSGDDEVQPQERNAGEAPQDGDRQEAEPAPPPATQETSAAEESPTAEPSSKPAAPDQPEQEPADPAAAALTEAGQHQDEVVATLERVLGELARGEGYGRLHREIGQLRRDQFDVAQESGKVGRDTLTKEFQDLTPQQQTDLKKLAQRQQELARQFEKVQERMSRMQQELAETDPLAADALADALHQAQEQAVSGEMREASRNLEQNQVGQAAQQQEQVDKDLQEMLDTLSNRREQELSRLVEKLRQAEDELAALRDKQEGLRKRMAEAAQNPDEGERRRELERLTREQRELEEQANRLARRLERLTADQASQSAAKAGSKMSQAGEQGEQGDAQGAQEKAQAAERDLEDAQQQLAERRRKAELDLAMEQLARFEDALTSLHARQQTVIDETQRLDDLKTQQGKLSRGQAVSLQDLARVEEALEAETSGMARKIAAAEVFSLALKGAAREMTRAGESLAALETGPPSQTPEQSALRRLAQLLKALEPDEPPEGQQGDQGEGGEGEQGGQPPGDGIPGLAQLKLLALLQEEVNSRTKALDETLGQRGNLNPDELSEYVDLAREQGQLAEMTLNLSQPAEEDPDADEAPQDGDSPPEVTTDGPPHEDRAEQPRQEDSP